VRDRIWRGILIFAVLLGIAAVLAAGLSRLAEQMSPLSVPSTAPELRNQINLPLALRSDPYPAPYPSAESAVSLELQGQSVDLIIGAAVLVLIIVGGVIYGRSR
jgi:hypothetical protein